MWRFVIGHPVSGAVLSTLEASAARVLDAGLSLTLDEVNSPKEAEWQGLGEFPDRAWVQVQSLRPDGSWQTLFSGTSLQSPDPDAQEPGKYLLVGAKYKRLNEEPVDQERTVKGPIDAQLTALFTGLTAQLPYLTVGPVTPSSLIGGERVHNFEPSDVAINAVAGAAGYGWGVTPGGVLWAAPKTAAIGAEILADDSQTGVEIEWRDRTTEALVTAVVWSVTRRTDGSLISWESRHAQAGALGRSAIPRLIRPQDVGAVTSLTAGTYRNGARVLSPAERAILVGESPNDGLIRTLQYRRASGDTDLSLTLSEPCEDVVLDTQPLGPGAAVTVSRYQPDPRGGPGSAVQTSPVPLPVGRQRLGLGPMTAQSVIRVSLPTADTDAINFTGLRGLTLARDLLDVAAGSLYHLPARRVGKATLPGFVPFGSAVRALYRGAEVRERCAGLRYLLSVEHGEQTEVMIGESDTDRDAEAIKVIVDRRDRAAVREAAGI
jgi:hypothetical protein